MKRIACRRRSLSFWTGPLSAICLTAVFYATSGAHENPQSASAAFSAANTVSETSVPLENGKVLERDLARGKKDVFQISLSQDQLAVIVLRHQADLALRILDPEDTLAVEIDTSAGQQESILDFVADKSGTYTIDIKSQYTQIAAGKYRISIQELRPASTQDRLLEEARRQYWQAQRLYRAVAYPEAQAAAERALESRENIWGAENPEIASSLNMLALICAARGEYDRGQKLLQRALEINEKIFGVDSLPVAEIDDSLAQSYYSKANYAEALRLAKRAIDLREKRVGSDHFLVALPVETLAQISLDKGEYSNARTFAERALEITAKSYAPDDLPYTDAVSLVARAQMRQGAFGAAEQVLLENLRVREKGAGQDSLQVANSLQDLGLLYSLMIENVKSEQMNLKALSLKEKLLGPNHPQLTRILTNLGLVYYRRGDYATANRFYQRSLAIGEKSFGPNHPQVAVALNNLGLMYWRQLDYSKAAECYRRALAIQEMVNGPDSEEATYAQVNLGIIAKETGNLEQAEEYYKRALAIKEKTLGPQHPAVGVLLESLGILYRDKGDYARAEPFLLRSLAITEASGGVDHPDNIRHLRNLLQLYEAEGDTKKALLTIQRLTSLEEKNLPLNLAVGSERQKLAYFDPFMKSLEEIISFQSQEGASNPEVRDLAATALAQRKGRVLDALADSLGALWKRSNNDDRAALEELKNVTSQLAGLVLNGPQRLSIAEHQQRIQALTERREQLENEIARRSGGYYDATQSVTLAAIQMAIPANAVLIEFAVYRPFDPKKSFESHQQFGDPHYVAYLIPARGEIASRDLGPAKNIDVSVSAFRDAVRDPERHDIEELARSLDEKIMRPVRLLTGDATHLLVSPDGQLDLIPFEALIDEHGQFLVERFSISYLTTGRDLLRMQVSRASKSGPVVIADPSFGEPQTLLARADQPEAGARASLRRRRSVTTGQDLSEVYFAPLSGTAQEARAIQSLFPEARVLSGPAATKAVLKEINAPSILHIATHGFFLQDAASASDPQKEAGQTRAIRATAHIENPLLRSGLALSGANLNKSGNESGILTALEASNLNLWGTKLVTLSACETGVGEVRNGEGVYGLRRSFFLAGAETLVMSLWPVSDRVTREMMTSYYSGLKRGLGRGEALRQAELAMMKRKDRRHPFYWASFIQSGEWANLDGKR